MAIVETDLVQQPATGGARDVMMVIAVNADGTPISGGGGVAATWDTIEGKPAFVGAGDTAAEARTAIGAGTSNLVIGTTASTAKAGNYVPTWAEVTGKPATFAPTIGATATTALAGNTPLLQIGTTATTALAGNTVIPPATTWANISGKPAVVAAGADAAAARTAIGAGTSNLTLAQSQAGIATKAAIAALTPESTLEDVIAALQA